MEKKAAIRERPTRETDAVKWDAQVTVPHQILMQIFLDFMTVLKSLSTTTSEWAPVSSFGGPCMHRFRLAQGLSTAHSAGKYF